MGKVGWRVTTDPALQDFQQSQELTLDDLQQEQQQAQLYLQIYDKGGEGYNDENSLLKGGVERQVFAPSIDTYASAAVPPPMASQPSQNENNAHRNNTHET